MNKSILSNKTKWSDQVKILSEALPYMRQFSGETIVIKFGGHAMADPELAKFFALDIVLLRQVGIHPIVIHGGGPQIETMLEKLGIKSSFINGLRVTDEKTMDIVEMVLSGSINKDIVSKINTAGGRAVGVCGKDGNLLYAEKIKLPISSSVRDEDLGLVGEPKIVDPHILEAFKTSNIIPVIAPIGIGPNGETLNINADTVAGAISSATKASRLYMLTDVPGVIGNDGNLISDISISEAEQLMSEGIITGGMIPKIKTCIQAINSGVECAAILDGTVRHSILIELFTAGGAGTLLKTN